MLEILNMMTAMRFFSTCPEQSREFVSNIHLLFWVVIRHSTSVKDLAKSETIKLGYGFIISSLSTFKVLISGLKLSYNQLTLSVSTALSAAT